MKKFRLKRKYLIIATSVALVLIAILVFSRQQANLPEQAIDSFNGVAVYDNGPDFTAIHGKNYSPDGYYYGCKWQCVEYVKRYYYLKKKHCMPDLFGNARDFFDPAISQGKINYLRGLIQYRNGGDMKPHVEDLLVFTRAKYGHVAIVTAVESDYIEIIQQNVASGTRQKIKLEMRNGRYYLGNGKEPAAWLRKE